jgi:hypothetical protein
MRGGVQGEEVSEKGAPPVNRNLLAPPSRFMMSGVFSRRTQTPSSAPPSRGVVTPSDGRPHRQSGLSDASLWTTAVTQRTDSGIFVPPTALSHPNMPSPPKEGDERTGRSDGRGPPRGDARRTVRFSGTDGLTAMSGRASMISVDSRSGDVSPEQSDTGAAPTVVDGGSLGATGTLGSGQETQRPTDEQAQDPFDDSAAVEVQEAAEEARVGHGPSEGQHVKDDVRPDLAEVTEVQKNERAQGPVVTGLSEDQKVAGGNPSAIEENSPGVGTAAETTTPKPAADAPKGQATDATTPRSEGQAGTGTETRSSPAGDDPPEKAKNTKDESPTVNAAK